MKKIFTIIFFILLISLIFCSCSQTLLDEIGDNDTQKIEQVFILEDLKTYSSIDEFQKALYEDELKFLNGDYYYPVNLLPSASFKDITVRANSYVAIRFYVPNDIVNYNTIEFSTTAVYVWHIVDDAEYALKTLVDNNKKEFKAVEYDGKIYYNQNITISKEDATIVRYDFFFISDDNRLIQVGIPAVVSFDEIFKYTEIRHGNS
jgi:hypothetical protein